MKEYAFRVLIAVRGGSYNYVPYQDDVELVFRSGYHPIQAPRIFVLFELPGADRKLKK